MKKLFTPILGLLLMLGTQAQAAEFETAKDAVKNMGVGWNLGNTLESVNWDGKDGWNWASPADHEIGWGQSITKPELMKMMKEAGFGAIRVPVTWFQEMDANGKVNDAWMKRVKEVVDYVIDNGMYCILNVHHDTGAHDLHWVVADETYYNNSKTKFEALWKQIAEVFKDYDQHLLFEAYNEMLDAKNCWNYPTSTGTYNADYAKKSLEAVNNYAQSFVTSVRATGGNNATRNLIVNTYAAACGGVWGDNTHPQEPLEQLKLPADDATGHLIVEVHSYPNISSGFTQAKNGLDWTFNNINEKLATRLNVPIIIGEWGSSNVDAGAGKTDYDLRKTDYLKFVDYFVSKAKELGFATFYWMGLSDGSARELPVFNQADIAKTIVKAYYGDASGKFPTTDDYQINYTIKFTDEWSEAFLFGDWNSSGVKLSDYKDITVETDAAYGDALQIKVYGEKDGKNTDGSDKYKVQEVKLSASSETTTATFDAAVLGKTITYIMLQTLSGAKTVKVKNVTLTKADGSVVSGNVSKGWGCEVTSEYAEKTSAIKAIQTKNIDADDTIYNLQGQRINTPKKGIYIKNGRKYIAK